MAIEEPIFNVVEKDNSFELRTYQPKIIAEVYVNADMNESARNGFRLIADYIFGNNTARSGNAESISMTAPVVVQATHQGWKVYFVMPKKYTISNLPAPNSHQIIIKQVQQKKIAVIKFSGLVDEVKMDKKAKELHEWMINKHLIPIGNPELARYNPPWTLPFLRRNEVMVEFK